MPGSTHAALMGAPVLFRQVRPGLHGTPFIIYKLRTMTDKRNKEENLLPDKIKSG